MKSVDELEIRFSLSIHREEISSLRQRTTRISSSENLERNRTSNAT